jgi:hypothetical protein
MGVGGQHHAPAALPPGNTRYPLYRRLGEPQGRSGRVRKISTPPGFNPWTVKPVASRYAYWAIPSHFEWYDDNPKAVQKQHFDCLILDVLTLNNFLIGHSASYVHSFLNIELVCPTFAQLIRSCPICCLLEQSSRIDNLHPLGHPVTCRPLSNDKRDAL